MRNNQLFFLVFLLLSACASPEMIDMNHVAGEIVNPTGKPVIITQQLSPVEIAHGQVALSDTIEVDSTRMAGIDKKFDEGYYLLQYGKLKRPFYLKPGKTLSFKINTKDSSRTVEYGGKMKLIARYLQHKDKVIEEFRKEVRYLYLLDEAPFLHKIDSSRKVLDSLLVKLITNNPRVDESFVEQQAISNQYFIASYAMKYPRYAAYYNPSDSFKLSENYFDNFKTLNVNDPKGLTSHSFTHYLQTMIDEKVNAEYEANIEKYQNDEYASFSIGLDIMDSTFKNEEVKNYMVYRQLKDIIKYTAPDVSKEHLLYLDVNCTDSLYRTTLNKDLLEWEGLKKGNNAPIFRYDDIEGNSVSISDFSGKYIYIDVWATWCGPCVAEIPHLKNLEHKYGEKNIEFVSVSLDENVSDWKKMVHEKKLKGTQLYAGGWKSKIAKQYKINSIPRFILVDPQGKIVSARAKRPSNGIEKELDQLLN